MRLAVIILALLQLSLDVASAQTARCWTHWQGTAAPFTGLQRSRELLSDIAAPGVFRHGRAIMQHCTARDTLAGQSVQNQFSLLPVTVVTQSNSDYPRQQQDGLRWSGRGLSTTIRAGASAQWGPISAALMPTLAYHQNEEFSTLSIPLPALSPYGAFYHAGVIDRPTRFGDESAWWSHPGQSFVRLDAYGAAIGVSTENMSWGPARRNPIVMSAAGPGFPHVFAGTSKPVNLRIIDVGVEAIWGRLAESEYFDTLSNNDERLFAGIVATISPRGSGLTLGIARAYLRTIPIGGLSLSDQIFGPYTGIRVNPTDETGGDNQLASVFLSWVSSGLEAYGEYAREDHWEDSNDLLMQLDHSRGYTVGLEKVFALGNGERLLRVLGEATNLGHSPTFQSRRTGATFYTHSQVRQGYTHKGQLLGAPIGPGSDAQFVGIDYVTPRYLGGLYYERVRYDNDAYYTHFAFEGGNRGHDTEWTIGLRGGGMVRDFQIVGDIAYSTRYNRDFVDLTTAGTFTDENNLSISVGAAWVPAWARIVP